MKRCIAYSLALATTAAAQDTAPRRLTAVPLRVEARFGTVSGARELRDGSVLVSDAKDVAVYRIDPKTGTASKIGSAGGDSLQYTQPGGFYAGVRDTTLLLDRGLRRILVIAPDGRFVASRSIARKGTSGGSDADIDFQRVDARVLAYFLDGRGLAARLSGLVQDSAILLRFDPVKQRGDTVAKLRQRESRQTVIDEHRTIGQAVIGSPQDDWGVAPDGRVAVVRAAPYHVEWFAPNGQVTRGPVIDYERIPFTAAEREAFSARTSSVSAVGGGAAGERDGGAATKRVISFAEHKPAFDLNAVIVAPDGRVWVERSRPSNATSVVYDVFDDHGARVDRVALPARSRVIGFGASAVYVSERDDADRASLKKYKL